MYEKRLQYQKNELVKKQLILTNKIKFLQMFNNGQLNIFRRKKSEIELELTMNEFDEIDDSFDYLLDMSFKSLTHKSNLENDLQNVTFKLNNFETVEQVWIRELNELHQEITSLE
jgi:hypothetical protein